MDKEVQFKKEFINLYSELNLCALLDKIAAKICDYLNCEESAIFLYDSIKEELFFEIATGEKQEELKKIVMKKGEGLVGWVAENDKSVIVNDCSRDPRFTAIADEKTNFVTSSLLAVPVRRDRKFLGVLEAVNKIDDKFDETEQQLLESIANFISIPLQNAMLFKKVTADTKEKERLIELGKIVSRSFDLDEVFSTLKDVISEIIVPLEINVMVKSQDKTYQLIPNKKVPYRDKGIIDTTIDGAQAVFPLKTENKSLGYLEIKANKKIPEEVVSLIRGVAIFAAISIEKFEMYAQMLEKEKIEKELQIAKEIQQSFLLNEKIHIAGVNVAYVNIPSSEVGGDYYDIVKLNEDETIFTINDISGHGIPASLLMAIFRANFTYRIKKDNDMLTTVNYLNNLIAETTDQNHFVTSFTGYLELEKKKFRYINAGHNPPLLFRGEQVIEVIELSEGATILGMFPDIPRWVVEMELQTGDLLVLYTDGVIEAENSSGEPFSGERFKNFMKKCKALNLSAESIKEKLILELKGFVNKDHFDDDVTFIIIRIG